MVRYYYLVSYDFTVGDSEVLEGYRLLGRHDKIGQSENPVGEINRIINNIKVDIWKEYRKDNNIIQKDDIKVILRNLQLIE